VTRPTIRRLTVPDGPDRNAALEETIAEGLGGLVDADSITHIQVQHDPGCRAADSGDMNDCTCARLIFLLPRTLDAVPGIDNVRDVLDRLDRLDLPALVDKINRCAGEGADADAEALPLLRVMRTRLQSMPPQLRRWSAMTSYLVETNGSLTKAAFEDAVAVLERARDAADTIDLVLLELEDLRRRCRAARPRPAAPERPAADPVEVDTLCSRCGRRDRHFDDLCKRCADEVGVRPKGKVA
jgi:hypothetical protein